MPIDVPKSVYRQVADILRASINSGEYAPGSALPSEPTLADQYGVSRVTINNAVRLLRNEGIVKVRRGSGTYVRSIPPIARNMATRYSRAAREEHGARGAFQAELERLGLGARSELVEVGPVAPPATVASALHLAAGQQTLIRKRHMFANDIPVLLATSFVPWSIAQGTALEHVDTGTGGTYSRLAELGFEPAYFTDAIEVRSPSTDEAAFLDLDDEQQVLHIEHIAWTTDSQPVEVRIDALPTYQWILNYEWSAEPLS